MIETNIVWFESCALEDVRRMDSSQLTRDQQGLLNFDEFVALLYFIITVWYGCARYRNSKFAIEQQANRNSAHSVARHQFSPIHWAILLIAIMGLANFLFSLSLLEIMDHKSSIGSTVLKFSYVNMVFACLLHPCTLSLGVLAPMVAFGNDHHFYLPSESAARAGGTKSSTMCLAVLVCAQLVLRLTENVMVLFCYGGRPNSETVKLADFFEYVLDGVFLVRMIQSLHKITMEISNDRGGSFGVNRWQVWWKSRNLLIFWSLYSIFAAVSTVLIVIGVYAFFSASVFGNQHFVYTDYKVHAVNDLILLTGIAIVLRPLPIGHSQEAENDNVEVTQDPEINYHLLHAESNEDEAQADGDDDVEEDGEIVFEMTHTDFGNR